MSDWQNLKLKEVCSNITSGGTPTAGNPRYYHENATIPFLKIEDLTRSSGDFIVNNSEFISEIAIVESSAKVFPRGTVLITMYGTIGLAKILREEMSGNQALCALLPPFKVDTKYLLSLLEFYRDSWTKFIGQTTQANINGKTVKEKSFSFPPLPEQRLIAKILDTLDTSIRRTEDIIAKLQKVKDGLLHDLLTRGVDESVQLRPRPEDAPHLYKDSPLGKIPKEWEVKELSVILDVFGGKRLPAGHTYSIVATEYKYFRVTDFSPQKPIEDLESISHDTFCKLARYEIFEDEIFLSIAGSIGLSGVMRMDDFSGNVILTENACRLSKKVGDLSSDFIVTQFQSSIIQRQVQLEIGTGGGVPKLAIFRIERFKVLLPAFVEQLKIDTSLNNLKKQIEVEKNVLNKLRLLKQGLMNDLLTGKVRVTDLLKQEAV